MKRLLALIILFVGIIGGGTYFALTELTDPYTIEDWHDLNNIRVKNEEQDNYIGGLSGDYVLGNDLDNNTEGYEEVINSGDGWEPIGTFEAGGGYSGIFDGQGYTISDMKITRSSSSGVGIFCTGNGMEFRKTVIENFDVDGGQYTGTVVGADTHGVTIIDVEVKDSDVNGSDSQVGGILGADVGSGGYIKDSTVMNTEVSSSASSLDRSDAGMIIGKITSGEVINCFVYGSTLSGVLVDSGGAVGLLQDSKVEGCHIDVDIYQVADQGDYDERGSAIGGAVGFVDSGSIVKDSDTEGYMHVYWHVNGGVAGRNAGEIKNSNSTIEIYGENKWVGNSGPDDPTNQTDPRNSGGIAGRNEGLIYQSSYTGEEGLHIESEEIYSEANVGGVVGQNEGIVKESFADTDIFSWGLAGAFIGKNMSGGKVYNSYSIGEVSSSDDKDGAFIGWMADGVVENCYSLNETGFGEEGFVYDASVDTVYNCYWNTSYETEYDTHYVDYETGSADGSMDVDNEGTTETMTWEYSEDTYVGWDFEEVWENGNHSKVVDNYGNTGYPALQWQEANEEPIVFKVRESNGTPIEDARIEITDSNGEIVSVVFTTINGNAYFYNYETDNEYEYEVEHRRYETEKDSFTAQNGGKIIVILEKTDLYGESGSGLRVFAGHERLEPLDNDPIIPYGTPATIRVETLEDGELSGNYDVEVLFDGEEVIMNEEYPGEYYGYVQTNGLELDNYPVDVSAEYVARYQQVDEVYLENSGDIRIGPKGGVDSTFDPPMPEDIPNWIKYSSIIFLILAFLFLPDGGWDNTPKNWFEGSSLGSWTHPTGWEVVVLALVVSIAIFFGIRGVSTMTVFFGVLSFLTGVSVFMEIGEPSRPLASIGTGGSWFAYALSGSAFGFAFLTISSYISSGIGYQIMQLEAVLPLVPIFLITGLATPIVEEGGFRGVLLPVISERLGIIPAIVLTSILFGFSHFLLGATMSLFVATMVFSLFVSYITLKTQSIVFAVVSHMVYNMSVLAVMLSLNMFVFPLILLLLSLIFVVWKVVK